MKVESRKRRMENGKRRREPSEIFSKLNFTGQEREKGKRKREKGKRKRENGTR